MAITSNLEDMKLTELRQLAKQMHLRGTSTMNKNELVATLHAARTGGQAPQGVSVDLPEESLTNNNVKNLANDAEMSSSSHTSAQGEEDVKEEEVQAVKTAKNGTAKKADKKENSHSQKSFETNGSHAVEEAAGRTMSRRARLLNSVRSQGMTEFELSDDDIADALDLPFDTKDSDVQDYATRDSVKKAAQDTGVRRGLVNRGASKSDGNAASNRRSAMKDNDGEDLLAQLNIAAPAKDSHTREEELEKQEVERKRRLAETMASYGLSEGDFTHRRAAGRRESGESLPRYATEAAQGSEDFQEDLSDILEILGSDSYDTTSSRNRLSADSAQRGKQSRAGEGARASRTKVSPDSQRSDAAYGEEPVVRRRGRVRSAALAQANGTSQAADKSEQDKLARAARHLSASPRRSKTDPTDYFNEVSSSILKNIGLDEHSAAQHSTRDETSSPRDRRADSSHNEEVELVPIAGIVDILDSYAFIRTSGYLPGSNDVYVSMGQIKKYGLRKGDAVQGTIKPNQEVDKKTQRQKFVPLQSIDRINELTVAEASTRPHFAKLTPLYPQERLKQETTSANITGRLVDLIAPIGKGQRGLIVSPPKAGKTLTLQSIAQSITANNPQVHLMVVLVDERPEEVTDMERTVDGEVISSTFDRPASDHTMVAELAIERAKRLVELGQDVVVLLDSMTRLARAYNLAVPASGRVLSGGVDAQALYLPKKFFGAARNIENGGSLTIISSALVETGSKMDEVIFEEFKGTGNMELRLSRDLADKRYFPAIDINSSGTRREELITPPGTLPAIYALRRLLGGMEAEQAYQTLVPRLKKTKNNAEFLAGFAGKIAQMNS